MTSDDEIRQLLASLPPQAFWAPPGEVAILERKVIQAGGHPDAVLAWVKAHGGRLDRTVPAAMRSAYSKLPIPAPQRYYVLPADALADDAAA